MTSVTDRPQRRRAAAVLVALLIAIVLGSFAVRLVTDIPFLAAGTAPEPEDFESRYVAHPWLAYLHIVPGVIYLLGAPLQLSYRFRSRHYTFHRRLGRVLLTAAIVSGVFAIAFGIRFAFGGPSEAWATVVFGSWFLVSLGMAFRAIKRGEAANHRRWMIRAFATGLAVGTIRIWLGLFALTGLFDFSDSFGVAFWVAFVPHVLFAEWWIRATPRLGRMRFPAFRRTVHVRSRGRRDGIGDEIAADVIRDRQVAEHIAML
jgi:uncharacterized membrane protein